MDSNGSLLCESIISHLNAIPFERLEALVTGLQTSFLSLSLSVVYRPFSPSKRPGFALLRSLPWGFNRGKVWNGVVVSRYIIQDKDVFPRQSRRPILPCWTVLKNISIGAGQDKTNGSQFQPQYCETVSLSTNASYSAVQPPSPLYKKIHYPQPLQHCKSYFYITNLNPQRSPWETKTSLSLSSGYPPPAYFLKGLLVIKIAATGTCTEIFALNIGQHYYSTFNQNVRFTEKTIPFAILAKDLYPSHRFRC